MNSRSLQKRGQDFVSESPVEFLRAPPEIQQRDNKLIGEEHRGRIFFFAVEWFQEDQQSKHDQVLIHPWLQSILIKQDEQQSEHYDRSHVARSVTENRNYEGGR